MQLGARTKVYLIDDEISLQRALCRLMRSAGFDAASYANIDDFLATDIKSESACVVVDVHMPGTNSLDLPAELRERGITLPVIYITAHDNAETRTKVRHGGAAGYFRKPVDDQALIDAINWAVSDSPKLDS